MDDTTGGGSPAGTASVAFGSSVRFRPLRSPADAGPRPPLEPTRVTERGSSIGLRYSVDLRPDAATQVTFHRSSATRGARSHQVHLGLAGTFPSAPPRLTGSRTSTVSPADEGASASQLDGRCHCSLHADHESAPSGIGEKAASASCKDSAVPLSACMPLIPVGRSQTVSRALGPVRWLDAWLVVPWGHSTSSAAAAACWRGMTAPVVHSGWTDQAAFRSAAGGE